MSVEITYQSYATLVEATLELADLVDAAAAGEYKYDSFTSQPARSALAALGADDGPGNLICKEHEVEGCQECWAAELADNDDG